MTVRQLRRLSAPVNDTLHDVLSSQLLHNVGWRSQSDAVEREHPELIVRDGESLLAATVRGESVLLYGFENARVFFDHFPAMFEKLLPKLRKQRGVEKVRFRLAYNPARPMVEPVVRRLGFVQKRDWLEFALEKRQLVAQAAPRGVKFRDMVAGDLPELVRIDREGFPDTPLDRDGLRATIADMGEIIVATVGAEVAGSCIFGQVEPGRGWIQVLGVDEAHRGAGIGAALTARAAKRLFAEGATEVGLTTDEDNGAAIRLYVRLGFRQTRAGRDYVRPVDEKAYAKQRAQSETTVIRFGGWR